jgi:transcriptional regulator with XRE-family HTH domain
LSYRSKSSLVKRLLKRPFRNAFVEEHVKTAVPHQIRAMRKKEGWTQIGLAQRARTSQSAITRIEDTNYGNLSINTLLKVAAAFDVGLLVKFVPFNRLVREFEDLSAAALVPRPFKKDLAALSPWASEITAQSDNTARAERIQQIDDEFSEFLGESHGNGVTAKPRFRPQHTNAYRITPEYRKISNAR